eukprot:TRINITY_DN10521_c0_g2_i2.p1 TRINITY_DN10521_c0_g2~~TRINITY_DN10521_c0_g2_i2.p1  ORF type:complete len:135 (+),score=20.52 TRINITY_DN10521_c0_g2_i2:112-516(+)
MTNPVAPSGLGLKKLREESHEAFAKAVETFLLPLAVTGWAEASPYHKRFLQRRPVNRAPAVACSTWMKLLPMTTLTRRRCFCPCCVKQNCEGLESRGGEEGEPNESKSDRASSPGEHHQSARHCTFPSLPSRLP